MKKMCLNRFLFCVCLVCLSVSCRGSYEYQGSSSANSAKKNMRQASSSYKDAPKQITLPLLNGGAKNVDVVQGRYIVKTVKDFDKSIFIKMGAQILSAKRLSEDSVFWHLYKNDSLFIKKVLKLKGVIAAEYDFAVQHIRPPKDNLERFKPSPEDGQKGRSKLKPLAAMGLEDGRMDKDPRTKEVNYSLQITHALEAYKELKNYHFKKPVLLGIIDTGFNYCNEDFWFDNKNGEKESIAYFVKSPFLPGVATKEFLTTVNSPLDENNPEFPYAKKFLQKYKYTGRPFEVPCTKVSPRSAKSGYDSSDCAFFWNWDDGEHGSHCTGMMAAVGNNNKGVAGVSWKNTKIASYKCFGGVATGWEIYGSLADYVDYIIRGKAGTLNEVYPAEEIVAKDGENTDKADNPYTTEQEKFEPYKDQGIYPINMSLGGPLPNEFMATVLVKALENGVWPVVAMGNDGQRVPEFPASLEGVLAVGATTGQDRKKHFSCSGEWIDICAPGDGILSTGISPGHNYPWSLRAIPDLNGGTFLPWENKTLSHSYTTMSGTSMATPFMTGVLGYLLSFENARGKDVGWLKAVVQSTADPLEGQIKGEHTEDYGYGRVNVLEAGRAVVANKSFAGTEWDYNAKNSVTIKLKNKRWRALDSEGNMHGTNDLGLSGHPVVVYEEGSGEPKGFAMTNNLGEASFFFLRRDKKYVARANIQGDFYETSFEMKDEKQKIMIEYDSALLYIATMSPHSDLFKKYSPNGEYNEDVDTIITIYEDGNFDEPIDRFDYFALDTMAFNAKPGKTYFADITCFADPASGEYRAGMYGFLISYDLLPSANSGYGPAVRGSTDSINPLKVDVGVRQPNTGRLIYELIHGMDCWEPNDSFEEARARGCFIDFAKQANGGAGLKSYVLCCLTNQSDGIDRDIFMFKVPEWEKE